MDGALPAESALSIAELEAQITELTGHLNAATYRWLSLIAEFDRRSGWSDSATQSCAHWLNWRCGIGLGAAREKLRVAQQQATRCLWYSHDTDGSLVVKARLPAEAGAIFLKALEAAMEEIPDVPAGTSDERPSFVARRVDALGILAESFLAHGAEALTGGEREQIVVHVDAETLRQGTAGRCELEHGPSLAAETARRLACDASLIRILEDERGEPLDVGRKTRSIPPAIRRALNARDRGCRFPGCPNKRYVDGHHLRHWAEGGETKLSNLVTLCRFHHRQVHEGGVLIRRLDDGALRFVKPDGRSFDANTRAPLGDWTQLAAAHREQGIPIDPDTATSRWLGERIDYSIAIDALLYQTRRARNVPAGTSADRDQSPAGI